MKYRKKDFILVPNKTELQKLPVTAQCLWMWLCSYGNGQGECWPSRELLRRHIGVDSLKTVDRNMKLLEKAGFVRKKSRYENNKQRSNFYELMLVGGTSVTPVMNVARDTHVQEGGHTCRTELSKELNKKEKELSAKELAAKRKQIADMLSGKTK